MTLEDKLHQAEDASALLEVAKSAIAERDRLRKECDAALAELKERTAAHSEEVRARQDIRDAWHEDSAALHEMAAKFEAERDLARKERDRS